MNGAPCICSTCKTKLQRISNNDLDKSALPDPVDFASLHFPRISRTSGVTDLKDLTNCSCSICEIALTFCGQVGHNFGGQSKQRPHQLGRPPIPKPATLPAPKPVTICQRCRQVIGKGIRHPQPCTLTDRRDNMESQIAEDPKFGEKLAADIVKQKISEAPDGAKCIELATPSGNTFKVPITQAHRNRMAKYPDSPIPAAELKKLMTVNKMSFRALERDAQFYRALKGRDFFESGALDILKTELESMKHFFEMKFFKFDAKHKKDGQLRLPIVYCQNLQTVIDYLKTCRGFHENTNYIIT